MQRLRWKSPGVRLRFILGGHLCYTLRVDVLYARRGRSYKLLIKYIVSRNFQDPERFNFFSSIPKQSEAFMQSEWLVFNNSLVVTCKRFGASFRSLCGRNVTIGICFITSLLLNYSSTQLSYHSRIIRETEQAWTRAAIEASKVCRSKGSPLACCYDRMNITWLLSQDAFCPCLWIKIYILLISVYSTAKGNRTASNMYRFLYPR